MWIGFSKIIDRNQIAGELQTIFPGATVAVLDDLAELSDDKTKWPEVVLTVDLNESDFPFVVHFVWWPNTANGIEEFHLAKSLGTKYECKTIIDGSGYGDDDSPFWCIIYDNGTFYLADDNDSAFGDRESGRGPVKIVKKLQLKT